VEAGRQIYYQLRYLYRKIQRIKTWQLFLILILCAFVTATFLRLNNVGMVQRYNAVLSADKEGKDDDVANRMYDLQRYVSSHMNASTGQFDLTGQFERDVQSAREAAINSTNPNGNINAQADAVCKPRFSSYSQAYLQCFLDEISKYPAAPDPGSEVKFPHPALYRHNFSSPRLSPDFAGFSLLFTLAVLLLIVGRFLRLGLLFVLLKLRQRGIGS
jgi:hypothetical protein